MKLSNLSIFQSTCKVLNLHHIRRDHTCNPVPNAYCGNNFVYNVGVATFCRNNIATPCRSEEGLAGTLPSSNFSDSVGYYGDIEREFTLDERKALDAEGRAIITQHDVKVNGRASEVVGNLKKCIP